MKYALPGVLVVTTIVCLSLACTAQDQGGNPAAGSGEVFARSDPSTTDKILNFPYRLFSRIQGKMAFLDQQLTQQTEKYLQRMARVKINQSVQFFINRGKI
jgi:hypothetical protein